jgi:hypothetical protein
MWGCCATPAWFISLAASVYIASQVSQQANGNIPSSASKFLRPHDHSCFLPSYSPTSLLVTSDAPALNLFGLATNRVGVPDCWVPRLPAYITVQ